MRFITISTSIPAIPLRGQRHDPQYIVNMSLLNGMDMIALTDHNSCKNCRAAVRAGEEAGVTVVPGMELTTSEEAHVVCLFPTVEQAEAFGDYVESRSPEIRNGRKFLGISLLWIGRMRWWAGFPGFSSSKQHQRGRAARADGGIRRGGVPSSH